jgi:hypothetical protein
MSPSIDLRGSAQAKRVRTEEILLEMRANTSAVIRDARRKVREPRGDRSGTKPRDLNSEPFFISVNGKRSSRTTLRLIAGPLESETWKSAPNVALGALPVPHPSCWLTIMRSCSVHVCLFRRAHGKPVSMSIFGRKFTGANSVVPEACGSRSTTRRFAGSTGRAFRRGGRPSRA